MDSDKTVNIIYATGFIFMSHWKKIKIKNTAQYIKTFLTALNLIIIP